MVKLICSKCMNVYETEQTSHCPSCYAQKENLYVFSNSDAFIKKEIPNIIQERKNSGLEGHVDGLQSIIINAEPENWRKSIIELLQSTGLEYLESFETDNKKVCVLTQQDSADILIQQRTNMKQYNPFTNFNSHPKSKQLPNTRLETYVYRTNDIEAYVEIQKKPANRIYNT